MVTAAVPNSFSKSFRVLLLRRRSSFCINSIQQHQQREKRQLNLNKHYDYHNSQYYSLMSEPLTKKPKQVMKIGTHNGTFHCDEVFACYMLKLIPEYEDAEVIRTRDQAILNTCDIVVDVGGKFSHNAKRYDHHMREFCETFSSLNKEKPWSTKLSSAGLIYVFYGKRVIEIMMKRIAVENKFPADISEDQVELIYDKVYENFVEELDAVDNGIEQFEGEPRYKVTSTLSRRVGGLNPRWNEEDVDVDKRFHQAMELVGKEFNDKIFYYQLGWLPARDLVKFAVKTRSKTHSSGEVIKLDKNGCPWKDHLMDIEKELNIEGLIKYAVYQDPNNYWRIQCVPERPDGFSNRRSLPEPWRGLRDETLSSTTGIPGCIFVHSSGFIGGNKTYDGVIQMANFSLKK